MKTRGEITPYRTILDQIEQHPGQTCCQIAAALGVRADVLSSRLNKWRRAMLVRAEWTQGQTPGRKAWRYYPRPASQAPALLVFREQAGCAQYPFATVADFAAWTARLPYASERLRVQVYGSDRRLRGDSVGYVSAAEAVKFAEEQS